MLALLFITCALGLISVGTLIAGVGAIQLCAFLVAAPRAALFTGALTPDQIREFEEIVRGLAAYKDLFPSLKDLGSVEGGFAAIKSLPRDLEKLRLDVNNLRRLNVGRGQADRRPGQITEECARYLGGVAILLGIKSNSIHLDTPQGRTAEGICKDIFGAEYKAALTTSDIPLPTEYSGQVIELVSKFGTARRFGSVFPLGAGTVKLPKLTTDTTFGLIASSGAVTEKSPAFAFVTFAAEKFGGLVRLPSEIDEDSIVMLGTWLATYAARQIAYVEDWNFFCSTGAGSGINGSVAGLTVSTITNSKVIQLASTKTHYTDATLDNLRALRTVPDAAALRTSGYYMNPTFEALLSSYNTAGNKPYNPQAQISGTGAYPVGQTMGPTLDGFPIYWADVMPAYSSSVNASKVFILFGDASYQYLGIRNGIRFDTSREAAFATDEILIRALERFTIGLMAAGAVAGLETAGS